MDSIDHPDLKPARPLDTSSVAAFQADFDPERLDMYTSHWGLLHPSERALRHNYFRGLIQQSNVPPKHKRMWLHALHTHTMNAEERWRAGGEKRRNEIDKELLARRRKERLDFDRPGRSISTVRDLRWRDRLQDCLGLLNAIEDAECGDADDPSIPVDLLELHRRLAALSGSAKYRAERMTRSKKDDALKAARDEARKLRMELETLKAERAKG